MADENNTPGTVNRLNEDVGNVLLGSADFGNGGDPTFGLTEEQRTAVRSKMQPKIKTIPDGFGGQTAVREETRTVQTVDPYTNEVSVHPQIVQIPVSTDQVLAELKALLNDPDPNVRRYATMVFATTDYSGKDPNVQLPTQILDSGGNVHDLVKEVSDIQGQVAQSIPKTPGMLADAVAAAGEANTTLAPENNPFLIALGTQAMELISGEAGKKLGENEARAAIARLDDQLGAWKADTQKVRDMAAGNGPSAATIQGNQLIDSQQRAMAAQAATARGGNLAAAQRQAMVSGQQAELQGQQQILAARAKEQADAMHELGVQNAGITQGRGTSAALNSEVYGRGADLAKAGTTALAQGGQLFTNSQIARENSDLARRGQVLDAGTKLLGTSVPAGTSMSNNAANVGLGTKQLELEQEKFDNATSMWNQVFKPLVTAGTGTASDALAAQLK